MWQAGGRASRQAPHAHQSRPHSNTTQSQCHASPLLLTSPARVCLPWLHGYKSGSCSHAQPAQSEASSDRHAGTPVASASAPERRSGAVPSGPFWSAMRFLRFPDYAADVGDEMPLGDETRSRGEEMRTREAPGSRSDLTAAPASLGPQAESTSNLIEPRMKS